MKALISIVALLFSLSAFAEPQVVAGIEIGSKGIKAIAVEIDVKSDGEEYSVRSVYKKQRNSNLMAGVSADGLLQEDRIAAAKTEIASLFKELKSKDPQFIVVVASTAFQNVKNRAALSDAVLEATNQKLEYIVADEEMYYGLLACVPAKRLTSSILIDIGSGNAKMGYATPMASDGFESEVIPFGTITLKEAGAKVGPKGVDTILESDVAPKVKKAMQDKPGLGSLQRRIYIVGGAAWAATNLARPQDIDKAYVRLSVGEVQSLARRLADGSFSPKSGSEKADAEASRIMDVFSTDDLRAGVGLLSTILSELNGSKRAIIFPREGAEGGWLYGYMFAKYNKGR